MELETEGAGEGLMAASEGIAVESAILVEETGGS